MLHSLLIIYIVHGRVAPLVGCAEPDQNMYSTETCNRSAYVSSNR
jgi:hypothetical protein